MPAFQTLKDCLYMTHFMLEHIRVNEHILDDDRYKYLFSVEEVNRLVLEGTPFRDAYVEVGKKIANGEFHPGKKVDHTHEGSIGNLCNEEISARMGEVFDFFRARSEAHGE